MAASGKTYLVTYHISQASASLTTIGSNMKGKVVRFVLQRPIYTNVNPATNQGDLWGMLYEIIPRLQLMPDGGSNSGTQTGPTTTGITGQAVIYDEETISAGCSECELNGSPLMYRVIVPCDTTSGIEGILGALGGAVALAVNDTYQLDPAVIVNGVLSYGVPASDFTYVSSSTSTATVGAGTGLVTAVAAGSTEITITYVVGGQTFRDYINVDVSAS